MILCDPHVPVEDEHGFVQGGAHILHSNCLTNSLAGHSSKCVRPKSSFESEIISVNVPTCSKWHRYERSKDTTNGAPGLTTRTRSYERSFFATQHVSGLDSYGMRTISASLFDFILSRPSEPSSVRRNRGRNSKQVASGKGWNRGPLWTTGKSCCFFEVGFFHFRSLFLVDSCTSSCSNESEDLTQPQDLREESLLLSSGETVKRTHPSMSGI